MMELPPLPPEPQPPSEEKPGPFVETLLEMVEEHVGDREPTVLDTIGMIFALAAFMDTKLYHEELQEWERHKKMEEKLHSLHSGF
jgi:hypothetical protein